MAYSTEFKVDLVQYHEDYCGINKVIALVMARWRITNDEFPDGYAYHRFVIEPDLTQIGEGDNVFTPIEEVDEVLLEQWCVGSINDNMIREIYANARPKIQRMHEMKQLKTWYKRPDIDAVVPPT